ncbi:60S ribosomal protein L28-2 [Abeliophyllum distichum]|uniref:60S ribosomal protein L28-2 n=1 Tax=Abeliophyllum distichum TaxID=126358 RepID=A0ABD1PRJ0_9LAMI
MATVPGQLIWEIVKKNNCFLVKEFGNGTAGVVFSKEPNNLYNLHSNKHSSLANKKTVTIQPGKDQPDLKKAALARLCVVNKSLNVAKSGPKKKNRQAVKILSRK